MSGNQSLRGLLLTAAVHFTAMMAVAGSITSGNPKLQHDLQDLASVSLGKSATATQPAVLQQLAMERNIPLVGNRVFVEFFLRDSSAMSDALLASAGIVRDSYFRRVGTRV